MLAPIAHPLNLWHRRWARPDAAALAAVRGRTPATIVTGGSQGIGKALAGRFAEAGDTIVLVARRRELLEAAARDIRPRGEKEVFICPLDVTAPDCPAQLEAFLASNGLYANVLINNAAMGLGGPFCRQKAEDISDLVALNVAAATRLMRHVLPAMRARAQGGVLNVASVGGYVPGPNQAAYYASKAYILSLSEAVASEISGEGVRVCALAPGPVETRFHARMGANDALYRWIIPAQSPERVARAAWRGFEFWRRVTIPGLFPPVLAIVLRILPHFFTVPIVKCLLAPGPRVKKATP
jgi:short-subunit dehydrogenase